MEGQEGPAEGAGGDTELSWSETGGSGTCHEKCKTRTHRARQGRLYLEVFKMCIDIPWLQAETAIHHWRFYSAVLTRVIFLNASRSLPWLPRETSSLRVRGRPAKS